MSKKPEDKKKTNTPYNKMGFHTKNFSQDMSKPALGKKITYTTEDAPSGENDLPELH